MQLVLIRHGESLANQNNEFTGWTDVPLTTVGIAQAKTAGRLLASTGLTFQQCHTSFLKRAIMTAYFVLDEIGQESMFMQKSWRLNERHYGALRGMNKDEARKYYGKEQVARWRRGFYSIPPLLAQPDRARWYTHIPQVARPLGESLAMAQQRLLPYWFDQIAPPLLAGHNQLVVAHGSTIRAMIKYLENISDADIDGVEVENGQPIIYELTDHLDIMHKIFLKA